jgi:hypothetical protein
MTGVQTFHEMSEQTKKGGSFDLSKFKNVMLSLVLFSPMIIPISLCTISIAQQNVNCLFYLFTLLFVLMVRNYVIGTGDVKNTLINESADLCSAINYGSVNGNMTFSIFIIAYSIFYLYTPGYVQISQMNIGLLVLFILYGILDIMIKKNLGCFQYKAVNFMGLFFNILGGSIAGYIVVTILSALNLTNYLYFNMLSSNAMTCSVPKQQTFKCTVYKNGQVMSSSTTSSSPTS